MYVYDIYIYIYTPRTSLEGATRGTHLLQAGKGVWGLLTDYYCASRNGSL